MTERSPKYAVHDGFRMPMGFPIEGFASGQHYKPEATDIFVATYPKCGTTWTQYIVYLLLHGGQPLAPGQRLDELFPHLEEIGDAAVRALPTPRLIKTHLPLERDLLALADFLSLLGCDAHVAISLSLPSPSCTSSGHSDSAPDPFVRASSLSASRRDWAAEK